MERKENARCAREQSRKRERVSSRPPRRRRRRSLPLLRAALLLLLVLGVLRMGRWSAPAQEEPPASDLEQEAGAGGELYRQIQEFAREEPGAQEILEHWEDYPEELLELLARNPETLEFVRNYPREKDRAPAETVEEAQAGEIPLLLQWDPRWGYAQYGDGPMALNGCGPTALSMVICGLTGDASATPWAVAQYAQEMGYYVEGVGTSWELMSTGCRHFGVTARELPLSQSVMENALAGGEPILCSVGPGDFTTSGHFIVLAGLEDGAFQVRDPNRRSTSAKLWDYETLAPQIRNLWAYSAG